MDTWGTGLHEDVDPITNLKEFMIADYLNRVEWRIQRIEYICNQVEHEFLYPSGSIATSGVAEVEPASGNYYVASRVDVQASGINKIIQELIEAGTLNHSSIPYYPFYVGNV